MNYDLSVLTPEERLTLTLRGLYERCGYRKFRMSRFEEYRLYMENRDFLVSESILSFTDLDGRLLALKPDVTLSIVQHASEGEQRVYYIENVYRPDQAKRGFREITQMGLERIGRIDRCAIGEVAALAARSLYAVSPDSLLEISHMGFVTGLLNTLSLPSSAVEELLGLIGQKNIHGIREVCARAGLTDADAARVAALPGLCGSFEEILPQARALCVSPEMSAALDVIEALFRDLSGQSGLSPIRLDLSLSGSRDYYNGVIFGGYVKNVPKQVLSGGQYDPVLRRLSKAGEAIGFALYLNELEYLLSAPPQEDCDLLVVYGDEDDTAELLRYAAERRAAGERVVLCREDTPRPIRAATVLTSAKTFRIRKKES